MGYGNILQKCDQAIAAYLISVGAGTGSDVYPAKRSEDKELPCTIVESRSAVLTGNRESGVWEVECWVYVRTSGSGEDVENTGELPAIAAADRVSLTMDAFSVNTDQSGEMLATAINAASGAVQNFKCQDVTIEKIKAGFEATGMGWTDIIELQVICSANDATG
jgi:hypothetical protein